MEAPLPWTPRSTAGADRLDGIGGGAATAALDAALSAAARREALLLATVDDLQLQRQQCEHDASVARQQAQAAEKEREATAAELRHVKEQANEAVALAERLTDSLRTAAGVTTALRRENERLTKALHALRESRDTAHDNELAALTRRLASMQAERDGALARETVALEASRQERSSRQELVRTAVARARADLNAQLEEASTRAAAAQHKANASRVVASTCRRAAEGVRSECAQLQKANAALLALNARLLARFLRAAWRVDELGDGDGDHMAPAAAQFAVTRRRLGGMSRLRRADAEDTAAAVEAQLLSMLTAATASGGHGHVALPSVDGSSEVGEQLEGHAFPDPPSSPSPPPPPLPPLLGAADRRVLAKVTLDRDFDAASGGWDAFVTNAEAAVDTITGRDGDAMDD